MNERDLIKRLNLGDDEGRKTIERWDRWIESVTEIRDYEKHFKAITNATLDQLISIVDIDVDLVCPHHLMPIICRVHIAYLPKGKVLGLSKFARIARDIKRVNLQEFYTKSLVEILGKGLEPIWAMVIVEAKHGCVCYRGARARNSRTITSAIYGEHNPQLKKEFMDLVYQTKSL